MTRKEALLLLGLREGFTAKELDRARKMAMFKHHPDRGGDERLFKQIRVAIDVLSKKVVLPRIIVVQCGNVVNITAEWEALWQQKNSSNDG